MSTPHSLFGNLGKEKVCSPLPLEPAGTRAAADRDWPLFVRACLSPVRGWGPELRWLPNHCDTNRARAHRPMSVESVQVFGRKVLRLPPYRSTRRSPTRSAFLCFAHARRHPAVPSSAVPGTAARRGRCCYAPRTQHHAPRVLGLSLLSLLTRGVWCRDDSGRPSPLHTASAARAR